jgi:penicillin V acylase-like amidase (Ntn superfamily)
MKKLLTGFTISMLMYLPFASACTTFLLKKDGQLAFGKNYDWQTATGVVHTNLRGITKTSLPVDGSKPFQWSSSFGSVTFNQYGKEFPNGGMNEKGLVVELMWLDESEYPKADERPSLSVLQWIQYQLDKSSTVQEVIASDNSVRVSSAGAPQHYLVADANGNAATIEFLQGKMIVHTGKDLPYPVLANDTYNQSVKSYKRNGNGRFSTACKMVQQFETTTIKKPLVDYSFDVLKNVAQGDYTKWSIVYDISNRRIHFQTRKQPDLKIISINQFSFASSALPLMMDMNTSATGNVTKQFTTFSASTNRKMLMQAFRESSGRVEVPVHLQEAMAALGAWSASLPQ